MDHFTYFFGECLYYRHLIRRYHLEWIDRIRTDPRQIHRLDPCLFYRSSPYRLLRSHPWLEPCENSHQTNARSHIIETKKYGLNRIFLFFFWIRKMPILTNLCHHLHDIDRIVKMHLIISIDGPFHIQYFI